MVPVFDKRYHIYNRFRHFWAEIKKNEELSIKVKAAYIILPEQNFNNHLM